MLASAMQAQNPSRTYVITLKPVKGKRSGWQWKTDTIALEGSILYSKVMKAKEKFPAAVCKVIADTVLNQVKFAGIMRNRGISSIYWEGTLEGEKIKGRTEWKNGQGVQKFTFSGSAIKP
jgi:hypothetical protein